MASIQKKSKAKQVFKQQQQQESTQAKITEAAKAIVTQSTTGISGGDKCDICQRDHKTEVCTNMISKQASKIAGGGSVKS